MVADPNYFFDFVADKTLVDQIAGLTLTCTRTSNGGYYDEDGVYTVASTNTARFDHDPATLESRGLLFEESRTNQWTQTTDLDNGVWGATGITLLVDQAVAPDGTTTAALVTGGSGGGEGQQVFSRNPTSIVFGSPNTCSFYAKAGTATWITAQIGNISATVANNSWWNIATGTVGTPAGCTAGIEECQDGWYRCWWSFTPVDSGGADNAGILRIGIADADGETYPTALLDGRTYYLWGPQYERAATISSYIPTVGSTVTRTGDSCGNAAAGSVVELNDSSGHGTIFADFDNTGTHQATGVLVIYTGIYELEANGTMEVTGVGSWAKASTQGAHILVTGFDTTSQRAYVDGTAGTEETNAWTPSVVSSSGMVIGSRSAATVTGSLKYTGWLRRLAGWNSRLDNTDLEGLSDGTIEPYTPPEPEDGEWDPETGSGGEFATFDDWLQWHRKMCVRQRFGRGVQ